MAAKKKPEKKKESQGYIQRCYRALDALVRGLPWQHPGGPGKKGSPNMRVCHAALDYAAWALVALHDDDPRRQRVLSILRSQADPRPGLREGIGVVEGGFEQGPGDHHIAYHLLPTSSIGLVAQRAGDKEVFELALRVLGRWYAAMRQCALPDGRVFWPGTRRWPFKGRPPALSDDGLVHEPQWAVEPSARSQGVPYTLHAVLDGVHRRLAGMDFAFYDNRGGRRSWAWGAGQNRPGFAAIHALDLLLESGAKIPRDLPVVLCAPVKVWRDQAGNARFWITRTEEEIGGYIQGFFPAVEITAAGAGPSLVAWAPHRVPAGWS